MVSLVAGFGLSISLILAIGAQNAFVLRSGLRDAHVLAVCLTCALSDAVLIAGGVAGFGALIAKLPALDTAMRLGGAAFLAAYGARAFLSAWRGGAALEAAGATGSLRRAVATTLALTWLNPHVYLDTVVLIGSVSATYEARHLFAAGAIAGSFAFFFALGYGARRIAPVFARPGAWRALDALVGTLMWGIAAGLVAGL